MSNIDKYLNERLKTVDLQTERLKAKLKSLDDEIESICEKQKTISVNKDVTYELFSPKPAYSGENRENVQILEVNKLELMNNKTKVQEQVNRLLKEKEAIQNSLSDLRKMENYISRVNEKYHLNEVL